MIRVFLVDDHEIVRRGIAQLISAQPGMEVVGESETVRGVMERINVVLPDVVVLDVHLPDGNGIDLCRTIISAHPDIHALMLTAFDEDAASVAAVIAGASGYVLKNIRGGHLVDAINRVSQGRSLITRQMTERVRLSIVPRLDDVRVPTVELTSRERQAVEMITEGLTNRQIGDRLGISEKTVKNYVSGLLAKLGMQRRTQVATYGAKASMRAAQE